jgi:Dynein heavy chain AAA lid domain
MRILDCYFEKYVESEVKKVTKDDVILLESIITQLFVFAMIWSVGTTTTLDGRMKFDVFFREKITKLGIDFPEDKLVYDYKYNIETKEW